MQTFMKWILVAATSTPASAYIAQLYSGLNCEGDPYGSRNVYDNTCATGTGGFCSFLISTSGGSGQFACAYSPDACAGTCIDSTYADVLNQCFNTQNDAGCANALGSTYNEGGPVMNATSVNATGQYFEA